MSILHETDYINCWEVTALCLSLSLSLSVEWYCASVLVFKNCHPIYYLFVFVGVVFVVNELQIFV